LINAHEVHENMFLGEKEIKFRKKKKNKKKKK